MAFSRASDEYARTQHIQHAAPDRSFDYEKCTKHTRTQRNGQQTGEEKEAVVHENEMSPLSHPTKDLRAFKCEKETHRSPETVG